MKFNIPSASGACTVTILALMLVIIPAARPCLADAMAQKKIALNARLDSLEMEKQHRKRLGVSLATLDSVIIVCKDSMAFIKQEISLTGDSAAPTAFTGPVAAADSALSKRSFIKELLKKQLRLTVALPQTALDWVIAAVALVALMSGIVLMFGLIRAFVFRPKKSKASYTGTVRAQTPYTRQGLPGEGSGQKNNPVSPRPAAPANTFDMEALRRKIAHSEEQETVAQPLHIPVETPVVAAESAQDSETVKQRVIEAGREGLSVSEISRKFHVSVDSVALILKIANKK